MTRRTRISIAAGVVLLAVIAGWFRPTPLATHAINPHAAAWRLPSPADLERSSASLFAEARGAPWLGDGAGGAPAAGTGWTLMGLVGPAGDRAVLVRVGNDPLIKPYRAGDTLPDGSRLESVGSSGIVIDHDGCRMRRPLYPAGTDNPPNQPAEDACEPAGTD
jgi:hypothetical protein